MEKERADTTATPHDVGDFPKQAKGAAIVLRPVTLKNRCCAVLLVVQLAVATTAAVSAPIKSHARKMIPASPITALAVTPQQDLSTLSSMHIPFFLIQSPNGIIPIADL
ncbi:hypothetical protein [Nitratireductor sp. L15S-10]|uniref:hypothetical protein n=1 Tax=Nitratireductor sp. L15S-10 TaxID=3034028 RepID=UPI0038574677